MEGINIGTRLIPRGRGPSLAHSSDYQLRSCVRSPISDMPLQRVDIDHTSTTGESVNSAQTPTHRRCPSRLRDVRNPQFQGSRLHGPGQTVPKHTRPCGFLRPLRCYMFPMLQCIALGDGVSIHSIKPRGNLSVSLSRSPFFSTSDLLS